jgi:circadian clock protein KaiB
MNRNTCYRFRLYVAGDTANSVQARVNLGALCRTHLAGRYKIEVVDVYRHAERALLDGIFMTPALVKLAPSPVRMIVGTLNDSNALINELGLHAEAVGAG